MTKQLEKVKKLYSILTVCLICFGAMLLSEPAMETETFWRVGGVLLILFGIVKLFGYFSKDLLQLAFQFDFALGIISCVIGLAVFFRFGQLRNVLVVGIELFMLADALLKIQTAIDAKKIGVECWWVILIMSLTVAVIGALLFLQTYREQRAIAILLGLNLVIDGILNLFVVQSTVNTIRRNKEWEA